MDEMEFTEAESNVLDLMAEYQQYQEAGYVLKLYNLHRVPGLTISLRSIDEEEEEAAEEAVAPSEY